MTEVRWQKTEVREQKSGDPSALSELRRGTQMSDDRRQRTDDRRQRSDDRSQRSENRRQRTEGRWPVFALRATRRRAEVKWQKIEVGSRNVAFDKLRRDKVGNIGFRISYCRSGIQQCSAHFISIALPPTAASDRNLPAVLNLNSDAPYLYPFTFDLKPSTLYFCPHTLCLIPSPPTSINKSDLWTFSFER